jgi:hypothetical protein
VLEVLAYHSIASKIPSFVDRYHPKVEIIMKISIGAITAIITFPIVLGASTMCSKSLFRHVLKVQMLGRRARKAIHSLFIATVEDFMQIVNDLQTDLSLTVRLPSLF